MLLCLQVVCLRNGGATFCSTPLTSPSRCTQHFFYCLCTQAERVERAIFKCVGKEIHHLMLLHSAVCGPRLQWPAWLSLTRQVFENKCFKAKLVVSKKKKKSMYCKLNSVVWIELLWLNGFLVCPSAFFQLSLSMWRVHLQPGNVKL